MKSSKKEISVNQTRYVIKRPSSAKTLVRIYGLKKVMKEAKALEKTRFASS